MSEDLELLQAWGAGDKDAAGELIDRHVDGIARFFRSKLGSDVDDHVQETFTRCLALRKTLRPDSNVRAYLFAVARNLLCENLRTSLRLGVVEVLGTSLSDLTPSPSAAHLEREEQRILLEALRRIPLDAQILLELYYWESLSISELAVVLSVPGGTVKSRLHRARGELRAKVGELVSGRERLATTLTNFEDWARALKETV